jgi:hypothetical protein
VIPGAKGSLNIVDDFEAKLGIEHDQRIILSQRRKDAKISSRKRKFVPPFL